MKTAQERGYRSIRILLVLLVFLISFFTYFRNYSYPPHLFWDENYHIASAQKYLTHTFFMEPHPPLGKLFIALGEYLLHPNTRLDTKAFLTTDYISEVPAGFSFAGVRLFPTLFACLSAVLFFLILDRLGRRPLLAFLFSSLYLFENAMIVHSRGAMLESAQMFFILGFILYFVILFDRITDRKAVGSIRYAFFGVLFGLAMSVKLNSAMAVVFFMMLVLYEEAAVMKETGRRRLHHMLAAFFRRGVPFAAASLLVFAGVYYIHFSLARTPRSGRYYEALPTYRKIIDAKKTADIRNLPYELIQNIKYSFHYENGVPKYDYCKPGENGSLPITWPFGDKAINYRWLTENGKAHYLYLQGNPAVWLAGLIGIFLSVNVLVAYGVLHVKPKDRRLFTFMVAFLMYYLAYMASVISLERVMYLYHYFLALIASLILFYLVVIYLAADQLKKKDLTVYGVALAIVFIFFITYLFFSPLTYYGPLTDAQFQLRNWFSFWGLKSVL